MQLIEYASEPKELSTREGSLTLTVVVPTLNEAKNIPILYAALQNALESVNWEIVIVDDNSSDESPQLLIQMCEEHENFRFIRRFGRSGISTAGTEGMMSSYAPFIAVMDADGQHDETKLCEMLGILKSGQADVVVGSRFAEGADLTSFSNFRTKLSLWSNTIAQKYYGIPLADSMGNFFMLKREVIESAVPNLSGRGQKLLLDILLVSPEQTRVAEVPIVFGAREHGESKLSHIAAIDFGLQLWERKFGKVVPAKVVIDLATLLGSSICVTILTWAVMKLWFASTGIFPYAPYIVPFAAIPSVVIAYFVQQQLVPRRKRAKGRNVLIEVGEFTLIALPAIALASWVTAGVVGVGDPRLRHLFGASLVCSLGIIFAVNWRKELLSKR